MPLATQYHGGSAIASASVIRTHTLRLRCRADGARFWASPRCLPDSAARAPLVLASISPRRRQLLAQAGLPFRMLDPGEDPSLPRLDGWAAASLRALYKAARGACAAPGRLTLGADTVVVYQGHTLGKPATAEEARAMLFLLSGRSHYVYTAFCLALHLATRARARVYWLEIVRSRVRFCTLSSEEVEAYLASGAPFDKAGGYGIQDRRHDLVESVRGSYYNVVGLPVRQVCLALRCLRWQGGPVGRGFPDSPSL